MTALNEMLQPKLNALARRLEAYALSLKARGLFVEDVVRSRKSRKSKKSGKKSKPSVLPIALIAFVGLFLIFGHGRIKNHGARATQISSLVNASPTDMHSNCFRRGMVEACQALGAYYVSTNDPQAAQTTFSHACALGDAGSCFGHSGDEKVVSSDPAPTQQAPANKIGATP